ncbi:VWA domain-containing protein [Aliikangiella marina]|uniref:VWA domain-containing protein n=1 Tax=Aliikangiella marina TaxID=1712262 RepID=A0A545T2W6_9GAMM|nr:VWA domain-containing protein [Aliikangiella marina]TQV71550.1 VWA domain-containing protein [Aliikangiella marina]
MVINWADFHFIRPELLLLFVPALLLFWKLSHDTKKNSAWQKVISPHLLEFLFVKGKKTTSNSSLWLTAIITSLIILAISGPSVRQKSVPVFQTESAQVILLDLSLSMDATDIKPSRLERAKFKLLDLLEQTNEGTIALVVYAGDAFTISPLTSDAKTISNMVPTLSTGIMPVLGSRPDLAIEKSIQLLENAKYNRGQIIWMTDGVETEFVESVVDSINRSAFSLSILAIGTEQGAPIPLPDKSGFLKDRSGAIVVPKLQLATLNDIASETNSAIVELTADTQDIDYLKKAHELLTKDSTKGDDGEQKISRWIDDGYWIVWLALFFFFIKLLRSPASNSLAAMLIPGLLISSLCYAPSAAALSWKDLWLTKNQQAESAYKNGEYDKAAQLFEDSEWKATAQYKNGAFADAATHFDPKLSERSLYNHATSLAKGNNLQEALDAYNSLLEKNPEHEDAQFNKKIIEDLLKQQQEQQNQDQQNQDQQNQDQQQQQQQQDQSQQQEQQDQQSQQEQQQQQQQQEQAEQQQQQEQQMIEDQRDKSEKDQALEHWLEKIPDDPGGLLRRKMYREYQRRGRQQKEEKLW